MLKMNIKPVSQKVYSPIKPYQTRVICLHGDNGSSDSPLVCDLYPADILHSNSEGLEVRSPSGEGDFITEYEALSYTWGSNETTKSVVCNGTDFAITENLFQALQSLRRSYEHIRYLWVDAICINQADTDDKNQQVQQMTKIYQNASEVLIWLGPAADESDKVIDCLELIGTQYAKHGLTGMTAKRLMEIMRDPDNEENARTKSSLMTVFKNLDYLFPEHFPAAQYKAFYSRPWWSRGWVIQELSVARKPIFICGSKRISFEHLSDSASFLVSYGWHRIQKISLAENPQDLRRNAEHNWIVKSLLSTYASNVMYAFRRQYQKKHDSGECTLYSLLRTTCGIDNEGLRIKTTNERDRIFALLGLASDKEKLKIRVDYAKDLQDIYVDTSRALLENGHLELLSLRQKRNVTERNLPSWVRDWSAEIQWPYGDPTSLDKPFTTSGTSTPKVKVDITKKTVTIQGFTLNDIELLGSPAPTLSAENPGTDWNAIDIFISETQRLCRQQFTDEDISDILLGGIEYEGINDQGSLTIQHRRLTAKSYEGYGEMKKWLKIFRGLEHLNAKNARHETFSPEDLARSDSVHRGLQEMHGDPMTLVGMFGLGMSASLERKPFRSKTGYVGLGPPGIQKGDVISVFLGSNLPHVLRKLDQGGYQLVGEAYVHRIMDGELMKRDVTIEDYELF